MNYKKFEPLLGDWAPIMKDFIESKEMDAIYDRLKLDSRQKLIICPEYMNTYNAFEKCQLKDVKVVIVGQDPYHQYDKGTNTYVADGLAFSCSITDKPQPSLTSLYEAMEDDLYKGFDLKHEKVNDLSYLAEQGVLLLNSALTVVAKDPGSHVDLWKPFIHYLLAAIQGEKQGLVYIFMGKQAQYYADYINPLSSWVLEVEHPVACTYAGRKMKHENVFSKTNKILEDSGKTPIEWLKIIKDES